MLLDLNGAWHMGDGWGWWMVFGSGMTAVFWILVIWIVLAVGRHSSDRDGVRTTPDPTALDILEQRLARGELTGEEFETMRRHLTDTRSRVP